MVSHGDVWFKHLLDSRSQIPSVKQRPNRELTQHSGGDGVFWKMLQLQEIQTTSQSGGICVLCGTKWSLASCSGLETDLD